MAMATGSDDAKLMAEINVTPMVDVMLVLLIIFMVIVPLLDPGVKLSLPQSKNAVEDADITRSTSVVMAVTEDGKFYLGDRRIWLPDVPDRINQLLKDKPAHDRIVYIKGAESVEYGAIVSLVDAIRKAGYDRIGLVSKIETKSAGPRPAP
ncbi:MAG TPA: biopolymer transporter ExbD [Blastocatellia bacterium]|nr:biopolymer transporter ExbD [Blastocatellia bacterium]